MIVVLLLILLAACNPSEDSEKSIPLKLSIIITDYFDTDERESLVEIVESLDELTELMGEKAFHVAPMYKDIIFLITKYLFYTVL